MKIFNKYKFSDKSQAFGGRISIALALLSYVCFGYGAYIASKSRGEAGIVVGILALLSFIISIAGTIIGLLSFKEDNKFYALSNVGSFMCGLLCIFIMAVFLMGI